MTAALKAGAAYLVAGFGLGFLLGVVRVTLVAPRTGVLGAVLIEVPIMLTMLWPLCGLIIRVFGIENRAAHRLVMGGVAFILLMVVEALSAGVFLGQSAADFAAGLMTPAGCAGLAGQVMFGLFPLVWMWAAQRR